MQSGASTIAEIDAPALLFLLTAQRIEHRGVIAIRCRRMAVRMDRDSESNASAFEMRLRFDDRDEQRRQPVPGDLNADAEQNEGDDAQNSMRR